MSWVYLLLTIAVCCVIGAVLFAVLVWPIGETEDDEHEQGGIGS